jgi:DNA-damage-inducible protein J
VIAGLSGGGRDGSERVSKTATIWAQVEPRLKTEVEDILAELALSAFRTIHLLHRQIKLRCGLPFVVESPNGVTARTLCHYPELRS